MTFRPRYLIAVGGGLAALAVAVALLRSVSPTQVESYTLPGEPPVESFRFAAHYGILKELWVMPAADVAVRELVALPRFENVWPFNIYEPLAGRVTLTDVILDRSLLEQIQGHLPSNDDAIVQVVIKADCGVISMRWLGGDIEYLIAAPDCQ